MRFLTIWMSEHRNLLMGIVAFGLWTFANYWYFRRDIARIRRERRSHSWTVDLEAKTGKGGKTNIH